jgi:tRNA threonylcarbamoyladenosine modification (KEOPS) complex  Pcc1 subunit
MELEVTNADSKETIVYSSISTAARKMGYRQSSLSTYLKGDRSSPFKKNFGSD